MADLFEGWRIRYSFRSVLPSYQPKENEWNTENLGFKEKDWLEAEVCKKIKAGQLDPKEAYEKMTTDWVTYYHEMRRQSGQNVADQDDE